MSAFEISASLLRQFAFCPRIPYLTLVLGAHPPAPPWVSLGSSWHLDRLHKERRRAFAAYGLADARIISPCPLSHPDLAITGTADALLETPSFTAILECKSHVNPRSRGLLLQLYAYRLMAAASFNKPCTLCLLATRRARHLQSVSFPPNFHNFFLTTLAALRLSLSAGAMPVTHASPAKCAQCEYINWCADRL